MVNCGVIVSLKIKLFGQARSRNRLVQSYHKTRLITPSYPVTKL